MATLDSNVTSTCSDLNATAVKEIIDTDLTDSQINNFINMAYYISLPIANELDDCGAGDALCSIMLLLSAHFMTMYERQAKSESIGGEYSVTYMGYATGEGLRASLYGQQALAMDCSGKLATAGMKRATLDVASYYDLDEDA